MGEGRGGRREERGERREEGGERREERVRMRAKEMRVQDWRVPTVRCNNEGREGGGGVRLGHHEDTFIRNVTCTQQRQ